jgi:hypothetical protein
MALLCSFVVVGPTYGQEVIVARETKPEAPKQAAPPPEQTPSESATPEPEQAKPKPHRKKSTSAEPTLEEMRTAGALAAERRNNPSAAQTSRSGQSDSEPEPAPAPNRVIAETPRPPKRQTRSEPTSTPNRTSSRSAKPGAAGAVRPTLMESGREQPSASPLPKGQTPAP